MSLGYMKYQITKNGDNYTIEVFEDGNLLELQKISSGLGDPNLYTLFTQPITFDTSDNTWKSVNFAPTEHYTENVLTTSDFYASPESTSVGLLPITSVGGVDFPLVRKDSGEWVIWLSSSELVSHVDSGIHSVYTSGMDVVLVDATPVPTEEPTEPPTIPPIETPEEPTPEEPIDPSTIQVIAGQITGGSPKFQELSKAFLKIATRNKAGALDNMTKATIRELTSQLTDKDLFQLEDVITTMSEYVDSATGEEQKISNKVLRSLLNLKQQTQDRIDAIPEVLEETPVQEPSQEELVDQKTSEVLGDTSFEEIIESLIGKRVGRVPMQDFLSVLGQKPSEEAKVLISAFVASRKSEIDEIFGRELEGDDITVFRKFIRALYGKDRSQLIINIKHLFN